MAGISTTVMDNNHPRYSTSEALLESALEHARMHHSLETRMVKLRGLSFRACEGYYSKSAHCSTAAWISPSACRGVPPRGLKERAGKPPGWSGAIGLSQDRSGVGNRQLIGSGRASNPSTSTKPMAHFPYYTTAFE